MNYEAEICYVRVAYEANFGYCIEIRLSWQIIRIQ